MLLVCLVACQLFLTATAIETMETEDTTTLKTTDGNYYKYKKKTFN